MEFFDYWEFDCKCGGCMCNGESMHADLLRMIDEARRQAKVPFKITSGMRCPEYNKAVGGSTTSSHLDGYAADIATPTSSIRFAILDGLRAAGFTRIGVAKTFIHADCDPKKSGSQCWVY